LGNWQTGGSSKCGKIHVKIKGFGGTETWGEIGLGLQLTVMSCKTWTGGASSDWQRGRLLCCLNWSGKKRTVESKPMWVFWWTKKGEKPIKKGQKGKVILDPVGNRKTKAVNWKTGILRKHTLF